MSPFISTSINFQCIQAKKYTQKHILVWGQCICKKWGWSYMVHNCKMACNQILYLISCKENHNTSKVLVKSIDGKTKELESIMRMHELRPNTN